MNDRWINMRKNIEKTVENGKRKSYEINGNRDFHKCSTNKYTFNYILVETSNFKILKSFLVKKNYRFVERLSNYNIKHLPEFGDYLFKYAN